MPKMYPWDSRGIVILYSGIVILYSGIVILYSGIAVR